MVINENHKVRLLRVYECGECKTARREKRSSDKSHSLHYLWCKKYESFFLFFFSTNLIECNFFSGFWYSKYSVDVCVCVCFATIQASESYGFVTSFSINMQMRLTLIIRKLRVGQWRWASLISSTEKIRARADLYVSASSQLWAFESGCTC